MKSSLVFVADPRKNRWLSDALRGFFIDCELTAEFTWQKVEVTIQHSLKDDKLAVMVETAGKTFAAYDENPIIVFNKLAKELRSYWKTNGGHKKNQKKKSSSRTVSGRGRGRKSPARERRS